MIIKIQLSDGLETATIMRFNFSNYLILFISHTTPLLDYSLSSPSKKSVFEGFGKYPLASLSGLKGGAQNSSGLVEYESGS